MSEDNEKMKPSHPGDMTHAPLPYVVKISSIISEDSPPVITEHHVTAYSLVEALISASVEAGGGMILDDTKYRAVSATPDVPEYLRWMYFIPVRLPKDLKK
jgi:hypothetical protein